MPLPAILALVAAYFSLMMAVAVLYRDRCAFVHRAFAAGAFLLAVEELLRGASYSVALPEDVIYWHRWILVVESLIPAVWLGFSLTYARANASTLLSKWKWVLLALGLFPFLVVTIFWNSLFAGSISLDGAAGWSIPLSWAGQVQAVSFLVVSILILFNLERTIRSSVGRMRWQIKFMALGVGGLFALRIYMASQTLLFSRLETGFGMISAVAVLVADVLFALSLSRGRSLKVDVYLSAAAIQNSLTIALAGIYLVAVGTLAYFVRYFPTNRSLPLDAFVIFLSLTVLAVLLLSNRLRRKLRLFVSEHLRRPVYDYRRVWMELNQRTTSLVDAHELSTAVSRMVSESLDVLSVSVWLVDESQRRLTLAGSTALYGVRAREVEKAGKNASELMRFLLDQPGCVDLAEHDFEWPKEIMRAGKEFFQEHKMRYAIGLQAGGELVGVMTLNDDRAGGEETLSAEDFILLETLASQLGSSLLNLRLSARLRQAKELETFQTVSTFFVHDLKNLASRLSLTMQNLPTNFDSPEFRADALRVISASLSKIDDMCSRLAMLRQNIEPRLDACDLNRLVASTLDEFKSNLRADLKQEFQSLPKVRIDSEQIHKVLTNLVMNANEAVNGNGVIQVSTISEKGAVGFAVRDNGCGMSQEYIEKFLFRPFQTTKKKGLGIGLFHSRLIVEAHRGTVEVHSTVGTGTEFRVMLPIG